MDIQTFSRTYWYFWLLVSLLIVIVLVMNIGGTLKYLKKRRKFLDKFNEETTMNGRRTHEQEVESILNQSEKKRNSRIKSKRSLSGSMSIRTNTTVHPLSDISSLRRPILSARINVIKGKQSPMQLLDVTTIQNKPIHAINFDLKIFRRQALQEHNRTRAINQLLPLKLSDGLNISAQRWAEECAQSKIISSSKLHWRLQCNGVSFGEHLVSAKSNKAFDGRDFTRMIITEMDQSDGELCLLDELCTDVGFGCAHYQLPDGSHQWIAVAHYCPYKEE